MVEAGLRVNVSLKEVYERLCPKCKEKVRQLIKEKITDELVSKTLEG